MRLPPAVRARFADTAGAVDYVGEFEIVRASLLGRMIAWTCQLIGTPVVPRTGNDVPAIVHVAASPRGVEWRREYRWPGYTPIIVRSTKVIGADGTLIEELPAGRIAASPLDAEKLAWLAAHTRPGQFMLQAGWPSMYVPLGLRNPIYLDVIPGCGSATRLAYVALSVRQLEAKRVRYIVWSPRMESLDDSPAVFREYLRGRYRQIWRFSDQDEIWERRPEGDPSTSQRHASQAREPG